MPLLGQASLLADAVVTVDNASEVVNGDTSSMQALAKNPGPDGISLREAIMAAGETLGTKVIRFDARLKSVGIKLGSSGATDKPLPVLSGDCEIIGDVDGDGVADITLDGSLAPWPAGPSFGIMIWSSNNRIRCLNFTNFSGPGIIVHDPWSVNYSRVVTNNTIESCNIASRGTGVVTGRGL